jgi:uncharacterized protein (TIGR02271 family)
MTTRTITAMFKSTAEAQRAVDDVVSELGIARTDARLVPSGGVTEADYDASRPYEEKGFFAALKDLFVPDEDRYAYAEGMRRGSVLVSVKVDETRLERAMDILEQHGAVDLDEQEAEWRHGGWTGYDSTAAGTGAVLGSVSDGSRTGVAATAESAAPDGTPGNPQGTMLSRGVDQVAGTNISGARPENETGRMGVAGTAVAGGNRTTDEMIPIAEERLRVGKREVNRGRVRVRSYILEVPVEEQVQLREEHVHVERHAVDRPAGTDAANLFQERVIEATESVEEPVVSKEASVKEEVVIRKEADERVETVQDKIRRTEVDVEDERARSANVNLPGGAKRRDRA